MTQIHFVQLTDSHIGTTPEFQLRGATCLPKLAQTIDAINALDAPIDFVIHTGDIVTDADKPEADVTSTELAATELRRLKYPLYTVNGNHDHIPFLDQVFPLPANASQWSDLPGRNYEFRIDDQAFLILDARISAELDPAGKITAEALVKLGSWFKHNRGLSTTLFMHYPPVKLDSLWADEIALIQNGAELHQMLLPYQQQIRGVFFGHVHRNLQVAKDGIFYSACQATSCTFGLTPELSKATFYADPISSFNYISLSESTTIVKQHLITTEP